MQVGVPREIKSHEYRVGLTPSSVRELTSRGHPVLVERNAGIGISAGDADYERAGAEVVATDWAPAAIELAALPQRLPDPLPRRTQDPQRIGRGRAGCRIAECFPGRCSARCSRSRHS